MKEIKKERPRAIVHCDCLIVSSGCVNVAAIDLVLPTSGLPCAL